MVKNSQCHSPASWPLRFQYAWLVLNRHRTNGVWNCKLSYKMGPKTSYNWGEITPVSRVITAVTHLFQAMYRGCNPIYNWIWVHLVAILDDGMLTKVALSVTAAYRKCSSPSSQWRIIVLHELQAELMASTLRQRLSSYVTLASTWHAKHAEDAKHIHSIFKAYSKVSKTCKHI